MNTKTYDITIRLVLVDMGGSSMENVMKRATEAADHVTEMLGGAVTTSPRGWAVCCSLPRRRRCRRPATQGARSPPSTTRAAPP